MSSTTRSHFCRMARLSAIAGGLSALAAATAHAQTYDVSLDTTGLNPTDSYAIDLQLNQGATTPDSTVNVGSFMFGGGSANLSNPPGYFGDVTGDLASGVSLSSKTASTFNEFSQDFNQGSLLSFKVDATQLMAASGGAPDQFFFDLFDNTQSAQVATNDDPNRGALFLLTRAADGTYSAQNFGYTSGKTYTTTSAPSATPELGTVTSLGLLMGLFGVGALRARRGQARGAAGAE